MRTKIWLAVLLVVILEAPKSFTQPSQSPNIIFILTDDLGYGDLSRYGHRNLKTPNIDKLSAEGLTLTNFYAPSPLCSPSRAGMLTGRTPFRTGIKSWIPENDNIYLTNDEITIATSLKNKEYHTFFAGKWHLNGGLENTNHPQPQDHGFDHWLGTHNFTLPTHKNPDNFFRNGEALGELKGFAAEIVVEEAIHWMDTVNKDHPFFMYISLHEPHSEIASPDRFNASYKEFTNGEIDLENLADRGPGEYYANVSHMDYQVGRLLKRLEELNLEDQTMVVFTSDNGPVTNQWRYWWEVNMYGETGGLRGRKADLYEGGIRVPCIIRYPGKISAGSVSEVPLHGYDLLPTFCAIAKADLPKERVLDGLDFSPLFSSEPVTRKKPLFWAFEIRDFDDPNGYHYAVRDGNWKLITDKAVEKTLLYNLKEDPYEVLELSEKHPEIVSSLSAYIKTMVASIENDPLRPIHGPQSID